MEYRNGKCSSCEAEYKIPASFAHDVARCKECGGSVQIEPLASKPAAPKPAPPAPKPAAPVAKPAPKPAPPAPKPAPAAAADEPKKKKGGTLERLKRERAAEAAKLKAQEGAKPAGRPAAAKPAARPASVRPAAAKPTPRAKGAAAGSAAGAAAGAGSRKSSRSGRGSRRAKPEKKAPVGAILGIVAIVAIGGGVFFFKDSLFGDAAPTETQAKEDLDPTNTLDPVTPEETGEELAGGSDEGTPKDEGSGTGEEAPPTETASGGGEEPDPFAETKEKPKPAPPNPDSVDLLSLADFAPAKETSDAEWDQIQEDLAVWMDPYAGAAGNRAKARIQGLGYKSIPAILNRMKSMDFSTDTGLENGSQCQAALREICNGLNFNWQDGTEPKNVVFNKKVVLAWAKMWDEASTDIDKLIRMLKIESDSQEANDLRVIYGAEPVEITTPEVEEDTGGDEDDFEID